MYPRVFERVLVLPEEQSVETTRSSAALQSQTTSSAFSCALNEASIDVWTIVFRSST